MQVGLFLNRQMPGGSDPVKLVDGLIDQTRTARDAGFDLIVSGQHYVTDYTQLQTIPVLSRLAAEAGSMTLATGVILLPLHHPVYVAETMATLDVMAEDIVLGVGAGYRDKEFESFSVPKAERVPRLVEGIDLLERLLTDSAVTFDGKFYSVENVTLDPRPSERPPIWMAANATRAVERAAQITDAWFVNPHATLAEIERQKAVYDEIRAERGLNSAVPVFREAFVAETTEEARGVGREYLFEKYRRYLEWGQDEAMEDADDLDRPFDRLARDRFLLGTPPEVAEQIDDFRERVDTSHLVLRMNWPGLPAAETCDAIELVGDRIVPDL